LSPSTLKKRSTCPGAARDIWRSTEGVSKVRSTVLACRSAALHASLLGLTPDINPFDIESRSCRGRRQLAGSELQASAAAAWQGGEVPAARLPIGIIAGSNLNGRNGVVGVQRHRSVQLRLTIVSHVEPFDLVKYTEETTTPAWSDLSTRTKRSGSRQLPIVPSCWATPKYARPASRFLFQPQLITIAKG
jgi:hypothetical protein